MTIKHWLKLGFLAALLPLGACGDILEVDAPGRIADEDLNAKDAFPGLVVGMSYDLAQSIDSGLQELSLASGELFHGGSYDFADIPIGTILDEDVDGMWGSWHQARWVAEQGIERMRAVLTEQEFSRSPLVARAYLLAGFANRQLGENLCETVIDGGERQPHTVHFDRALEQFTTAIQIGTAADADDVVMAAHGGRASIRAWMGNWAGAVQDAQEVDDDFVYLAYFSTDGESNDLAYETHTRPEFTVYDTEFAEHPDDPRAPWEIRYNADGSVAKGANGATPFYRQNKYTELGSDVPLVKGTEMLVLRAEAALRNNQIGEAFALLNQARAEYGMDPLPVPATIGEAWDILHYERGATLWLEGRRLWDLRRWFEAGPSSPMYHAFLADRPNGRCIPISKEEKESNPNLAG